MAIQIYQAEWCPHSHRVRQRLTELGVEYEARQVEAEPGDREHLRHVSGQESIPVLVDGAVVVAGPDEIIAWLDERFEPRTDAEAHRRQAIDEAALLAEAPPAWPTAP